MKCGSTARAYRSSNPGNSSRIALRAHSTRQRASRCDTVRSLLIRLSVSSTIMRTRRSRRRSKNAEGTSAVDSYSNFGIACHRVKPGLRGVHSNGALQLRSGVLAISLGPDLVGDIGIDARLVVANRG